MEKLLGSLCREVETLAVAVRQDAPILDAYLYEARMRCGKAACRCMDSDYRHRLWCLSYTADGKSHTRTVPPEAVPEVRAMCEQYRQMRACRRRLQALADEAAAALDRHVLIRTAQGWRRFEEAKADLRKAAAPAVRGKRRSQP